MSGPIYPTTEDVVSEHASHLNILTLAISQSDQKSRERDEDLGKRIKVATLLASAAIGVWVGQGIGTLIGGAL